MAIRWDEFPHSEIRLRIHAQLGHNAVGRAADDSLQHILRRRLADCNAEDHRRFIELEARAAIEHLRCTRDVYTEFVDQHKCRPILEAHWVVLRCAVFPTAIAFLRPQVVGYAKLTRIPGRDLSLLFGIHTRTCYENVGSGIALIRPPDLNDDTAATDQELQSLGRLVNANTLLWFRDIHDGGGVGIPLGGGPFSVYDGIALRNSWALCGLRSATNLPDWATFREKLWHQHAPWTEGLCSLFGAVQEELLSQWRALPSDSLVHELEAGQHTSEFRSIAVPARESTIAEEDGRKNAVSSDRTRRKPGRKPRIPEEFVVFAGTLWRKAISRAYENVPDDQLRKIAVVLDKAGHVPPADYLEGKCAEEIRYFNSRNSNSKIGPIQTWFELVSRRDKDHLRGMRRLLSRCSKRLSHPPLSGN